jgi:hypothetical protein
MNHPLALSIAFVLLCFGARMSWLLAEASHVLAHQGAFDGVIAFFLIFLAPAPFLLCMLIALFVCGRSIDDSDDEIYP